jgi:NADPH-dependent curcumin reductase CurA
LAPQFSGVAAVTTLINRQVILKSRPQGIPQADNFAIVETPVGAIGNGEVLVRNIYLSVEPAMRGWVSDVGNYSVPVAIGAVMRAITVGRVVQSNDPRYQEGDYVTGMLGWQDYAVVSTNAIERKIEKSGAPISTSLGVLGINGITAYFGLLEVGQPKAGDTVVVSTAAGSVGSCVGQIAKIKGARTVGITGGAEKVKLCIDEFGYDTAVDYKADNFIAALDAACPNGIDVYYDNTAGAISDAVYQRLNVNARVVICGTASVASWNPPPLGPRVERVILTKRVRMQGFVVFDLLPRYGEALAQLAKWVNAGQLKYREDILQGIEAAPDAIAGLYRGENFGKRLIRIADE